MSLSRLAGCTKLHNMAATAPTGTNTWKGGVGRRRNALHNYILLRYAMHCDAESSTYWGSPNVVWLINDDEDDSMAYSLWISPFPSPHLCDQDRWLLSSGFRPWPLNGKLLLQAGRQSTKAQPAEGGRQCSKAQPAEGGRQSSDHRQTGVTVLQQASIVVSAGMLLLRLRQGHDFMSCGLAGPFLHVSDMHNPYVYGYEYDYE